MSLALSFWMQPKETQCCAENWEAWVRNLQTRPLTFSSLLKTCGKEQHSFLAHLCGCALIHNWVINTWSQFKKNKCISLYKLQHCTQNKQTDIQLTKYIWPPSCQVSHLQSPRCTHFALTPTSNWTSTPGICIFSSIDQPIWSPLSSQHSAVLEITSIGCRL